MKKQYYFIIPIIFMFYLLFLVIGNTYDNYKVNDKIGTLKEDINKTENQNNEIKKEITYYSTNAYKEKILKEEQNMAHIGEKVIVITPTNNINEINHISPFEFYSPKNNRESISQMSNLEKWIYVFTPES